MFHAVARTALTLRTVAKLVVGVTPLGGATDSALVAGAITFGDLLHSALHSPLVAAHRPEDLTSEKEEKIPGRSHHGKLRRNPAEREPVEVQQPGEERQPTDLYRKDKEDREHELRI